MCEHCALGDELPGLDRRGFIVASGAGLVSVLFRPEVASAARRFELICKGAWGAQAPTGDFRHHEIVRITIHHSAVALRDNRDAPRHLRGHQRYHQSLGWPDIAYHAIVDRHGNVYQGRPFAAQGDSATEYDTRGHLLVMCEGNFDSQRVSRAQLRALVDVVAWGCAAFEVAPRRIRGHRDYAATACPGGHLGRLIDDGTIRGRAGPAAVRRRREGPPVRCGWTSPRASDRAGHRLTVLSVTAAAPDYFVLVIEPATRVADPLTRRREGDEKI